DGTPTHFSLLCEEWMKAATPCSVSHLLLGGEALQTETLRRFYSRPEHSTITVTNVYGPTECCVDATSQIISNTTIPTTGVVPIGTHLAITSDPILDPHGNDLPIGVPGDLYISGAGVGRGYIGEPKLTAERFIELHGVRMYRTGDICCWNADGTIGYL